MRAHRFSWHYLLGEPWISPPLTETDYCRVFRNGEVACPAPWHNAKPYQLARRISFFAHPPDWSMEGTLEWKLAQCQFKTNTFKKMLRSAGRNESIAESFYTNCAAAHLKALSSQQAEKSVV